MNTRKFAGLLIAGLFYSQAALALVAIGTLATKQQPVPSIDSGYGLTLAQAAGQVQTN